MYMYKEYHASIQKISLFICENVKIIAMAHISSHVCTYCTCTYIVY